MRVIYLENSIKTVRYSTCGQHSSGSSGIELGSTNQVSKTRRISNPAKTQRYVDHILPARLYHPRPVFQCDKSGPVGSFKSCAGCLHVHYCGKECQVYDWKNGGHQKYCRDIQARRAGEQASLVECLDAERHRQLVSSRACQNATFYSSIGLSHTTLTSSGIVFKALP